MVVSGQLDGPAALPHEERTPPSTHWLRDWVGPRAGLDAVEKRTNLLLLPRIEPQLLGRMGRGLSSLELKRTCTILAQNIRVTEGLM
jgi:hypothetical protein